MKLRHILLAIMMIAMTITLSADLFISEYMEGSSSNRAIEIFNPSDSAVSLTGYSIKASSNGAAWAARLALTTIVATIPSHGRIVIHNNTANQTMLPFITAAVQNNGAIAYSSGSSYTTFTGNDAIGLFYSSTGNQADDALIDIFGTPPETPVVNPANFNVGSTVGAAVDHTIIRKPTVTTGNINWVASAGTDDDNSEWIVMPQDYFESIGLHTYTPGAPPSVAMPTFSPNGGVHVNTVSVEIECATAGAAIYYTVDGTDPTASSTLFTTGTPIELTSTTTIKAIGILAAHTNSPIATATFTVQTPITVASIYELRTQTAGDNTLYTMTGDVIVTKVHNTRNQKIIQDVDGANVGGIVLDFDATVGGVAYPNYAVGNKIEGGITGRLINYNGLLEFTPVVAPAATSATGQTVTIPVVTLAQINTDTSLYQSRLVKVENLFFTDTTPWALNRVYPIYQGLDAFSFRANTGAQDPIDYIEGEQSPSSGLTHVTGHIFRANNINFISARENTDFEVPGNTTVPQPPVELTATFAGLDVTISWKYPDYTLATGYNIYRSAVDALPGANEYDKLNGNLLILPAVRSFLDEDLDFGNYWYYVEAVYASEDGVSAVLPVVHEEIQPARNIFISEYVENGNTKAIELFNGHNETVALEGYSLKLSANGAAWSNELPLTGTLASRDVLVIYNDNASGTMNTYIATISGTVTTIIANNLINFNGNDAIGLFYMGTLIDIFGMVPPVSPAPSNFNVAGTNNAASSHTILRKSTVTEGNINWTASAGTSAGDSEWIVYAPTYFSTENTLGNHTMTDPIAYLTPAPTDLDAIVVANVVTLSWEEPTLDEVPFTHATTHEDAWYIGADDNSMFGTYTVAHRYTPAQLATMGVAGKYLTQVSFITNNDALSFTVKVWTGGSYESSAFDSGSEVASKAAGTVIEEDWTTVVLDTPIAIPTDTELWIGYSATVAITGYVAGADDSDSTALNGYGNLLNVEMTYAPQLNGWYTLSGFQTLLNTALGLNLPIIDKSWLIKGLAEDIDGTTIDFEPPLSYNVYRKLTAEADANYTLVGNSTSLSYPNTHVPNGAYSYVVKALYTGNAESEASNVATATVDYTPPTYTVEGHLSFALLGYTSSLVTVTLEGQDEEGVFGPATVTTGEFTLTEVPAGTYDVTVEFDHEGETRTYDAPAFTVSASTLVLTITVPESVSDGDVFAMPTATALRANYPNPFNPTTTIAFDMARSGHVSIEVYNIKGQKVKTLVNTGYDAGRHSVVWHGDDASGRNVGSGVYFYRMTTDGYTSVQKMLMMK